MKQLLALVFIFIVHNVQGQDCFFCGDREWALTAGYSVQRYDAIVLGVSRTSLQVPSEHEKKDGQFMLRFMEYTYLTIGSEMLIRPNFQIAPEIIAGRNFNFLDVNLGIIAYNDKFKSFYPAIIPEVGINLLGLIQLHYGYNLYLITPERSDRNYHRVSIRLIHFPKSW